MILIKRIWPIFPLLSSILLFFWPVFSKGWVPFPGDNLVGAYSPWNSYSFLGFSPGGVPHKAQGSDVLRQLYPWKFFSFEQLKNRQLPLWNPYSFSGTPHLANFQSGIFYPLSIVFLLLPFKLAWSIFIILQNLLACYFTWLFLREIKISFWPAIFGAVVFAYSLYFTVWLEYGNIGHAILWLPFCLFLVEKIVVELRLKWILLLVFSFLASIFAGYIQTTIYLFAFVYLYFYFRIFTTGSIKRKNFKLVIFTISGCFALLLGAIQILPTLEIFFFSAREAYPADKIYNLLLPLPNLVNVFVSDFFGNPASRNYWLKGTYIERVLYVGVLPLFFSLVGILAKRNKKLISFFFAGAIITLILNLKFLPAQFFYQLKIPFISTTVPTRMLYLFAFCLAVLASFGLDWYLKNQKTNRLVLKAIGLFLGVYILLWLFTLSAPVVFPGSWWVSYLKVSQRNLILPTIFAFSGVSLLFGKYLKKHLVLIVIFFITIFDLFFYFKKITPFSPKEFIYPETEITGFLKGKTGIDRFWGYGTAYIDSNFSTYLGLFSTDGYDALFINRYGELLSASDDGKVDTVIQRSDAFLNRGYGKENLKDNFFRQRLMNILGVKYVLYKDESLADTIRPDWGTFPEDTYNLIWQKGVWQVYENKEALPRIFLAQNYLVKKNDNEIIDSLLSKDFSYKNTVILEEDLDPGELLTKESSASMELLSYRPAEIKLKTKTTGGKLLFISDNYFPGWRGFVDGQEARIYRANYSFRAIFTPSGEHEIVFKYQPNSFKWGVILSFLSLSVIIILISILWGKKLLA